jgi:hypothetical protein
MDGFWDGVGRALGAGAKGIWLHQQIDELMDMSESAGMIHLGVWLPQVAKGEDDDDAVGRDLPSVDYIIQNLRNREDDEDPEIAQKTKTFRVHATAITAGL